MSKPLDVTNPMSLRCRACGSAIPDASEAEFATRQCHACATDNNADACKRKFDEVKAAGWGSVPMVKGGSFAIRSSPDERVTFKTPVHSADRIIQHPPVNVTGSYVPDSNAFRWVVDQPGPVRIDMRLVEVERGDNIVVTVAGSYEESRLLAKGWTRKHQAVHASLGNVTQRELDQGFCRAPGQAGIAQRAHEQHMRELEASRDKLVDEVHASPVVHCCPRCSGTRLKHGRVDATGGRFMCEVCGMGWGWDTAAAPAVTITALDPADVWRAVAHLPRATPRTDPLDVMHDSVSLRDLLARDKYLRCEMSGAVACVERHQSDPERNRPFLTPTQRAAVSAHWSAELRARVQAKAAADKERERNVVTMDGEEW